MYSYTQKLSLTQSRRYWQSTELLCSEAIYDFTSVASNLIEVAYKLTTYRYGMGRADDDAAFSGQS